MTEVGGIQRQGKTADFLKGQASETLGKIESQRGKSDEIMRKMGMEEETNGFQKPKDIGRAINSKRNVNRFREKNRIEI